MVNSHVDQTEAAYQTDSSRRQIGTFSAIFLIFNRMIGTGIFATPSNILSLSGSVGLALMIWVIGFLIAAAGLATYMEFGTGRWIFQNAHLQKHSLFCRSSSKWWGEELPRVCLQSTKLLGHQHVCYVRRSPRMGWVQLSCIWRIHTCRCWYWGWSMESTWSWTRLYNSRFPYPRLCS